MAEFNENEHPRVPPGTAEGGQFTSKEEGSSSTPSFATNASKLGSKEEIIGRQTPYETKSYLRLVRECKKDFKDFSSKLQLNLIDKFGFSKAFEDNWMQSIANFINDKTPGSEYTAIHNDLDDMSGTDFIVWTQKGPIGVDAKRELPDAKSLKLEVAKFAKNKDTGQSEWLPGWFNNPNSTTDVYAFCKADFGFSSKDIYDRIHAAMLDKSLNYKQRTTVLNNIENEFSRKMLLAKPKLDSPKNLKKRMLQKFSIKESTIQNEVKEMKEIFKEAQTISDIRTLKKFLYNEGASLERFVPNLDGTIKKIEIERPLAGRSGTSVVFSVDSDGSKRIFIKLDKEKLFS